MFRVHAERVLRTGRDSISRGGGPPRGGSCDNRSFIAFPAIREREAIQEISEGLHQ